MINPTSNRGLPPNLCADDPSLSFTCKGLDIAMASYTSELGWLNHPTDPHVQSAEMHNQAVNSLALMAGRIAQQAVDVLSMLSATYLFVVCQAIDLRIVEVRFLESLRNDFNDLTRHLVSSDGRDDEEAKAENTRLFESLAESWDSFTTLDLVERCEKTAVTITGLLIHRLAASHLEKAGSFSNSGDVLSCLTKCRAQLCALLCTTYKRVLSEQFSAYVSESPLITTTYLGRGAAALYTFVRKDLGVPFHRGLVDDPTSANGELGRERKTIGGWVSVIYEALRDGRVVDVLVKLLQDTKEEG